MNVKVAKEFGKAVGGRAQMRALSIVQALEWAFATEKAAIEFEDFAEPAGSDTIWRLMRQGVLGCKVDGGGVTPRHDDAEVIASVVACLPVGCGGKGMALQIARLVRMGSSPDWMPDAAPRCVPRDMRLTKHGMMARTEVMGHVETVWRGRKIKHDVVCCPVTWRPSAQEISAARREYLDWWGALLDLRATLATARLRTITLTDAMPPMKPWSVS